MTRLAVGLTLLLMSFLAALENVDGLHAPLTQLGVQRWMCELLVAAIAVGLLLRASRVHRRMLFPRRGLRLLAAGIVLHAAGAALATGAVVRALQLVPLAPGSGWSALPEVAELLAPQPLFAAAQLLLVVGTFRALCNLVSPSEFEADY